MSSSPPPRSAPTFHSRWLSPEGYLGAHLVAGFILALAAGILFAAIADQVFRAPVTLAADAYAQRVAQRILSPGMTSAMRFVSLFGTAQVLAVLSIAVIVWLRSFHSHRRLYAFTATMAGGALLNWLLKVYFQRARPGEYEPIVASHGYSFPSGHAMGSIMFFGSLAYVVYFSLERERRWRGAAVTLCVMAALLIGGSRIYLGVHYLSDVLAGFAMGLCWMGVCLSGTEGWVRWRDWQRRRAEDRAGGETGAAPGPR